MIILSGHVTNISWCIYIGGVSKNIILNFNGKYFLFIDVIGDGACFYYSLLKHREINEKFKDVETIRRFLCEAVLCNYDDDINLKKYSKLIKLI